jgi:hypothetical protein
MPVPKTCWEVCAEERWNVLESPVEYLEVQLREVLAHDRDVSISDEGES